MGAFGIFLLLVLVCICTPEMVTAAPPLDTRIFDGRDAYQGEVPYQLSLQTRSGFHFCGASLVQMNGIQFGITAAHCMAAASSLPSVYVIAGDLNFKDVTGLEQKRKVVQAVVHPDFGVGAPIANDIALIFWDEPFHLNGNVSTIDLPTTSMKEGSSIVVVTGWGITDEEFAPHHLQLVEIPVIKDDECKAVWNKGGEVVLDSMLCAGTLDKTTCNGDSGGPVEDKESQVLVGIVSFGPKGCLHPNLPAVFTEVAYFVEWIEEVVSSKK